MKKLTLLIPVCVFSCCSIVAMENKSDKISLFPALVKIQEAQIKAKKTTQDVFTHSDELDTKKKEFEKKQCFWARAAFAYTLYSSPLIGTTIAWCVMKPHDWLPRVVLVHELAPVVYCGIRSLDSGVGAQRTKQEYHVELRNALKSNTLKQVFQEYKESVQDALKNQPKMVTEQYRTVLEDLCVRDEQLKMDKHLKKLKPYPVDLSEVMRHSAPQHKSE